MSPPLIRIIGSLNLDFTTLTPRFPTPGETLTATSLSINAGGKGANQAVACGRASFVSHAEQDVQVEMVGAVGAGDTYYQTLLKPTLESSGVGCARVREVEGEATGTATIVVERKTGENFILVVPGANHAGMADRREVCERSFEERRPDVVVLQGEIPRDTVLEVLRHVRGLDDDQGQMCRVVLNPAPVFPQGIPLDLLKRPVVLVVNETELAQVTTSTVGLESKVDLSGELNRVSLDAIARDFHKAGVGNLIVTLGSRGVYSSNDNEEGIWESMLVPGVKVDKVVDTTAAGDTFVGFLTTILARWCSRHNASKNFDFKAAIFHANQAAALCVQRSGAMQSIPYDYEVPDVEMLDDEACGYRKVSGENRWEEMF